MFLYNYQRNYWLSSVYHSVIPLVIKNIITDASIPSVNSSVIIYQRIYQWKKYYRRTIHRRIISVCDSVGNIITDGICVLHRRKNFIGKTVKSCSEFKVFKNIYFNGWIMG
jgi:hypothetical protein